MKTLLLLIILALPMTQDRAYSPRRHPVPPLLLENADSRIASGLAQSPMGYPINISVDPIPRGSTVGLYGQFFKQNGVDEVLIMNGAKEYSLRVVVTPELFPKLEKLVFRLPPEITGEVLVSAIGLTYSNWVRFYVEDR